MGLQSGRIGNSNSLRGKDAKLLSKKTAYVYDVILDDSKPSKETQGFESAFIGSIRFRTLEDINASEAELPIAHPIEKNIISIPVKNELVEIYEFYPGFFGYRRIGLEFNPSFSNPEDSIDSAFKPQPDKDNSSKDYKSVSTTGISKSTGDTSDNIGYGKYYKRQTGIHKLKLYEGDYLIQSRHGQTIRFSGYNNDSKEFSPTIIIRNSESSKNRKISEVLPIEEDINRDGSSIVMSSNKYELPFTPGTIDDNGSSDFETKPASFQNYPSKLIGDQLLVNSGRVILSSKNAEMIFFSKKNYGFISDGALSIDNKLGINVSVGDNIHIVTNDRDINFFTGKGSIFLGNENLEPIVKGQQLVNILSELIDAITAQVFLTPSGPTASGPTNISDFGAIKGRLNDILSKLNQTS